MKDALKRKMRSNRGVTLLLTLLLFLVCAVTGSVLLAAGTASSGTVSERAKMDQRYFSVTSAVELLREAFDGQSVKITVALDNSGKQSSDSTPPGWSNEEGKFIVARSLYLLNELESIQWQTDYSDIIDNVSNDEAKYTLKASKGGEEIDKLKVKVTVQPSDADPSRLTFTVENDNGDPEKFRLKMDYSAGVVKEIGIDAVTYEVNWKVGAIS